MLAARVAASRQALEHVCSDAGARGSADHPKHDALQKTLVGAITMAPVLHSYLGSPNFISTVIDLDSRMRCGLAAHEIGNQLARKKIVYSFLL